MLETVFITIFFSFCTAFLVVLPKESLHNTFLGLSPIRWVMMFWLWMQAAALLMLNWISNQPKQHEKMTDWLRRGQRWSVIVWFSLFTIIACVIFLVVFRELKDPQLRRIFQNLLPCICALVFSGLYGLRLYVRDNLHSIGDRCRNFIDRIKHFTSHYSADIIAVCVLLMVSLGMLIPVTVTVNAVPECDFLDHISIAQQMEAGKVVLTPNFLFHALTVAIHILFPEVPIVDLGNCLVVAFQTTTVIILFFLLRWGLREILKEKSWIRAFLALALSLFMLLITPITIITWQNHNLYYGYIGIEVFHSPTIILLKPLALLLFLALANLFISADIEKTGRGIPVLLLAGVTIFCILAKPNFVISILPATFLMILIYLWQRRPIAWKPLIGGFLLPAALVLIWQYLAMFSEEHILSTESHILFAPFAVYRVYSDALLFKFILSILYPLAVYIGFFQDAKKSIELNFAWLTFLFGAFYTYFIAESGVTFKHANFAWSGQITLFILFVMSLLFYIRQFSQKKRVLSLWICGSLFLFHLASGILWYWVHLTHPLDMWW